MLIDTRSVPDWSAVTADAMCETARNPVARLVRPSHVENVRTPLIPRMGHLSGTTTRSRWGIPGRVVQRYRAERWPNGGEAFERAYVEFSLALEAMKFPMIDVLVGTHK
jgi:hypothetical protein